MTRQVRGIIVKAAVALAVAAALSLPSRAADNAAKVRVPLYINIESVYQAVDAKVVMPFERIDQPLAQWAPADRASVTFAALMRSVAAGDAATAGKYFRSLPPPAALSKNPDGSTLAFQQLSPKQFVEGYRQTFVPFGNVRILGRISTGDGGYLYVWMGTTVKQGPQVRGFRYSTAPSEMVTEITSQSPMEAFLINVLGRAPRESWSFDDAAPHPNDLNLSTKLGVRITFGVNEPPPEKQQVITQLFSQFASLALAGKFDEASGLLTAPSAKRLTGWAVTVAEKDRGSFQTFLGERRRILRIAAMGQVDVAFWINARISQPKPEDLQYSYVLWDSQSRPLLANLLFQGILDDVLRRNPEVSRWSGIPEPPPEPPTAPAGAKPPAAGLPARSGAGSGGS